MLPYRRHKRDEACDAEDQEGGRWERLRASIAGESAGELLAWCLIVRGRCERASGARKGASGLGGTQVE